MLYFFHHYELPVILQQAQIRLYTLLNLTWRQLTFSFPGIFLIANKQGQTEQVEVEEQDKVELLREKEGELRAPG